MTSRAVRASSFIATCPKSYRRAKLMLRAVRASSFIATCPKSYRRAKLMLSCSDARLLCAMRTDWVPKSQWSGAVQEFLKVIVSHSRTWNMNGCVIIDSEGNKKKYRLHMKKATGNRQRYASVKEAFPWYMRYYLYSDHLGFCANTVIDFGLAGPAAGIRIDVAVVINELIVISRKFTSHILALIFYHFGMPHLLRTADSLVDLWRAADDRLRDARCQQSFMSNLPVLSIAVTLLSGFHCRHAGVTSGRSQERSDKDGGLSRGLTRDDGQLCLLEQWSCGVSLSL
ncbi:hypothetical protein F2P81_009247 [Scophthalmus maximus]|uniref:Uncharacterized protein n=1 Tax=Scophthalmus maximus TaxID=52904 RepID=A0A6A4SY84_SCOMX|nr:hypothetical protein F2P81_009247 [Scophthalmus maximus]